VWETTIGLARAIEILIIVCGRPAGGPHRGPPSTARAGVTTDVQRTSNGRPTDVGNFEIRLEYLFPTLFEAFAGCGAMADAFRADGGIVAGLLERDPAKLPLLRAAHILLLQTGDVVLDDSSADWSRLSLVVELLACGAILYHMLYARSF